MIPWLLGWAMAPLMRLQWWEQRIVNVQQMGMNVNENAENSWQRDQNSSEPKCVKQIVSPGMNEQQRRGMHVDHYQ